MGDSSGSSVSSTGNGLTLTAGCAGAQSTWIECVHGGVGLTLCTACSALLYCHKKGKKIKNAM